MSVPAAFPEEQEFLFLLELIPPTVEEEEDGCVASAFHRAVPFSCGGVGSNQNSGSTEKGEDKSAQGSVRHNRMCLLDGAE